MSTGFGIGMAYAEWKHGAGAQVGPVPLRNNAGKTGNRDRDADEKNHGDGRENDSNDLQRAACQPPASLPFIEKNWFAFALTFHKPILSDL